MYSEAYTEFLDSDLGKKLVARGGPGIIDRIIDITAERFETTSPTLTPFFETIELIGQDLLAVLPEPQTPKAALNPKPAHASSLRRKKKPKRRQPQRRNANSMQRSVALVIL